MLQFQVESKDASSTHHPSAGYISAFKLPTKNEPRIPTTFNANHTKQHANSNQTQPDSSNSIETKSSLC